MSKELLALDIDEVLFPLVQEFVLHHNENYATELMHSSFTSYHFDQVLGVSLEESLKRVYEFTGRDHGYIEPLEAAQDGINRLATKFDIALVTARHPQFESTTKAWLDKNFHNVFKSITMIGYERAVGVDPITKAQVCKKIGAVALIDDSLEYATQAAEIGIEAVLFGDYPWNQTEELPGGVKRVKTWAELLEHFGVKE
jgi:uncharacterized HAD superfamily protein